MTDPQEDLDCRNVSRSGAGPSAVLVVGFDSFIMFLWSSKWLQIAHRIVALHRLVEVGVKGHLRCSTPAGPQARVYGSCKVLGPSFGPLGSHNWFGSSKHHPTQFSWSIGQETALEIFASHTPSNFTIRVNRSHDQSTWFYYLWSTEPHNQDIYIYIYIK